VDPVLKTGGVVHHNSADKGTWHRIESIIPGIFIQLHANLSISEKSQLFGKCSHLKILDIIGYSNNYFAETPRTPNPKIWESRHPQTPRFDAYGSGLHPKF